MESESLAAALEREHQQIDAGIEAFAAGPATRERDQQPLRDAVRALRRHIYLEEDLVFPPLRRTSLVAPVFVMLREHAQIWETLDALERELDEDTADGAALLLCHQLAVQLQHHNMKEEKIIYSQTDEVLDDAARARLRTFLATGETPSGWVCEKSRR